jgi:hypothetical protein
MFKGRTVRATLGLPLVAMLAFTMAACGPLGDDTSTSGAPSKTAASPTVTANGIEKLDGAAAIARATSATKSAKSLRLRGTAAFGGGEKYVFDFRFEGRDRAAGTLQLGTRTRTQKVEIIKLGSVVYFKGNKAFLRENVGADAVSIMDGKYVKVSSKDSDYADIESFTDLSEMLKEVTAQSLGWKMGKPATIDGKPTVTLSNNDGDQAYIATQGAPYLLRIANKTAEQTGRLDFLSYNERVDLRPPAASQVIDMTE